MKKFALLSRKAAVVLCLLALTSLARSQNFRTVNDGVEYAVDTREIGGFKVNIHLLKLDLRKVRLDVRHAGDKAIGVERTSSIAARSGAIAAINAGFFRLDKSQFAGDDVGMLMIDSFLWSEPSSNRTVISIINGRKMTDVSFDQWRFAGYLRWRSRDHPEVLKGVNREVKDNEIVAFTPAFGGVVPSKSGAVYVITRRHRVVSICTDKCEVPADGMVFAGTGTGAELLKQVRIHDKLEPVWDVASIESKRRSHLVEDAVAGVPRLIRNGKLDIPWEKEKSSKSFVETRHPRTAVAKLNDGKLLMIVVDGRSESSGGIGLANLANYLVQLGATDAMNLDGGGSSTMFLDGQVVNKPSDKEGERKVGDAILVTLRKRSKK